MAIMRVRKIGSVGVVKDLPSFELPPEAWTHSNNVRFLANRIEKIGGYIPVLTDGMPLDPPLAITSRNNTQDQIYGTAHGLYQVQGRQHLLVSKQIKNPNYKPDDPTDPDNPEKIPYQYDADADSTWYYTTLSNAIVMNTPRENPQGLVPYKTYFEEIPGWGFPKKGTRPDPDDPTKNQIDWKAGRIRSFRNYLVALDMTEGGVNLPQRVRWSNVAYVNELPPDWIEDEESKDGGFNDMTDANGRIVDGMPLRDSFVIYTDQETYLMEYVGGVMIFNFKKLFSDSGILAPECAVEFDQKHFVITRDDIFVHNGSSKQAIASGRVKQYLIDEISSVNPLATKVFAYTPQKEIWITYVGPGQTGSDPRDPADPSAQNLAWTANKCAIWNWEWDTWYFCDIPAAYDINMAAPPDLLTKEWDEFSQEDDYWDSDKISAEQWSELGKDFIKRIPYIASPDKCLYTLDVGLDHVKWKERYNEDGSHRDFIEETRPVVAELLRTHLDMDEVVENTRSHKFIRHITPQFRGDGLVNCYVGGSQNPTHEPTWDNWQQFDIEEDVKIDAFSNNRYPAIMFRDLAKGQWSFQGYDIDFVVEGNR
ncbi:MAG: hypothetical protein ACRC6V_07310 [Bacteroidales bacterium]